MFTFTSKLKESLRPINLERFLEKSTHNATGTVNQEHHSVGAQRTRVAESNVDTDFHL